MEEADGLVAEGQILQDAVGIGRIDLLGSAEAPAALGAFGLQQVPFAGAHAHDFAASGYLEPLGDRFLGLNAFGASHNLLVLFLQKDAQYRWCAQCAQAVFL
jgi:hypothetical protein